MSQAKRTAEDLSRMAKESFQTRNQSAENRTAWTACERRLVQLQNGEVNGNAFVRDWAVRVRQAMALASGEKLLDAEFHMQDVGNDPAPDSVHSIFAAAAAVDVNLFKQED